MNNKGGDIAKIDKSLSQDLSKKLNFPSSKSNIKSTKKSIIRQTTTNIPKSARGYQNYSNPYPRNTLGFTKARTSI